MAVLRRGDFSFSWVSRSCSSPPFCPGAGAAVWPVAAERQRCPGNSLARGPGTAPRAEQQTHPAPMSSQPLAPCPLAHPRHGIRFSTLRGFWSWYLLPILPVACSNAGGSGTGELLQQFVLEGALSVLGGRVPVELGSRIPALGVCTSLKRGLSPKWIVLSWIIVSLSQLNV